MPLEVGVGLPEYRVEIAFDSGYFTPEGDRTWTDVSEWVNGEEQIQITRGRQDERSTPEPGRLSLTLDNTDGRFTPEREASPYYPNVRKGRPIRVLRGTGDDTAVRFTGYIDEWPVTWPEGTDEACVVELVASSRMARIAASDPLLSALRTEILLDQPMGYWSANQAGRDFPIPDESRSGGGYAMRARNPASGYALLARNRLGPLDEGSMVLFPHIGVYEDVTEYPFLYAALRRPTTGRCTVECVIRFQAFPELNVEFGFYTGSTVRAISASTQDGQVYAMLNMSVVDGLTTIVLQVIYQTSDTSADTAYASGSAGVADEELHHLAITQDGATFKAWSDGVEVASLTIPSAPTSGFRNFRIGDLVDGAAAWIGHLAVTDTALSGARLARHAAAIDGFPGESVATRVGRLADYAGIPSGERDISADSSSPMLPLSQAGRGAGETLTALAVADSGVVLDGRDGHLKFLSRQSRYNPVSTLALSAELQEVESDLSAVVDDQYLVNRVTVTRDEAEIVYEDAQSIADYGVYSAQIDFLAAANAEAEAAALWTIRQSAKPKPRISRISVSPANLSATQVGAVQDADIGTVVTITDLPPQAPAPSMDLFVEGYTETFSATDWRITFNTSPADIEAQAAWILGDAVLGVLGDTTYLAY